MCPAPERVGGWTRPSLSLSTTRSSSPAGHPPGASRRCCELILQLAGGELLDQPVIAGVLPPIERPPIALRFEKIRRLLGIEIPADEAVRILVALGLKPAELGRPRQLAKEATFIPPSWRRDLTREADLIEEVARVHGYEHIPEDRPVPLAGSTRSLRERIESAVGAALTGLGFDEAITYSLVDDGLVAPLDPGAVGPPLRAEHTDWKRKNALRPSLVPSLLAARAYNEAHGIADPRLFELADVYLVRPGEARPDESARIGLVAGLVGAAVA